MTQTQIKVKKAKDNFEKLRLNQRFNKENIQNELDKINSILKKELRFSKDLRNVQYLNDYFLERKYYKTLISLF